MAKTTEALSINVRLSQDMLDRADALAERIAQRPEYQAVRVSRSMVIRLAVIRGLAVLDAESATPAGEAATKPAKRRAKGQS